MLRNQLKDGAVTEMGKCPLQVQGRQDETEKGKHLSSDQQNTNKLEEKLFFLG